MVAADARIVKFFARASSRLRARSDAPVTPSQPAVANGVPDTPVATGEPGQEPSQEPGQELVPQPDEELAEEPAEEPYEIVAVDPDAVTLDLANRLARLDRAELIGAGRDVASISGPALLAALRRHGIGIWVAGPGARALVHPVGWSVVSRRAEDAATDPDGAVERIAVLHGSVAAEHRASGLGRELLSRALARAADEGCTVVAATVWEASEAEEFLWRRGFGERGTPGTVRRLDLAATAERRRRITDDASSYGASYQVLRESEDVDGARIYRVRARHLINGAAAGSAELTVAEATPEHAADGDVRVEPEHRGNRLGILMLGDLLSWIQMDRPRVRVAQSSVPASATHVVAVLDRLGSRIAGVQVELRRRLH